MGQPVIVTGGQVDDTATAFAAGVATAQAAQAGQVAEEAADTAVQAAVEAAEATGAAWSAQDAVSELRDDLRGLEDRMLGMFGDLVDQLNDVAEDVAQEDDGAPEVVVSGTGDVNLDKDKGDPDKPENKAKPKHARSTGFGSNLWFGSKR
jgi:hypothetical protein